MSWTSEPTPVESTKWVFPPAEDWPDQDLVAGGADLEPGTLLEAYLHGLFPMRVGDPPEVLGWWSPDPRGVMPLDGFKVSRSLRRHRRHFSVSVDRQFGAVMMGCADVRRPHGWIDDSFLDAYDRLHALGIAHSVEVWTPDGQLAGGLYGVRIGGFFAGESMFHRVTDASKVALWATCELLRLDGARLFDVQWTTEHLVSLGAIDVARSQYLALLADAVAS